MCEQAAYSTRGAMHNRGFNGSNPMHLLDQRPCSQTFGQQPGGLHAGDIVGKLD